MMLIVLLGLAGSAFAGMSGPVLDGHDHFLSEQSFLLKGGHGEKMAPFGGGFPLGPVILQGNHGPIHQGQPILIKGGLPVPHAPPLLFKGPAPHRGRFSGHAPQPEEPTFIIKGNFGLPQGGHAPLLQGSPMVLKNVHPPQPFVHGQPIIIRGGLGHGGPPVKGSGHTLQGPTILIKGGNPHGFKGGSPIILKRGFGGPVGGGAIGLGQEQHAVAGPSYLITTVHHVQKVSGGGKLLASFGGSSHAKAVGPPFGHGGHVINKGW